MPAALPYYEYFNLKYNYYSYSVLSIKMRKFTQCSMGKSLMKK